MAKEKETTYEAQPCTEEQVGAETFNSGMLMICPPSDKLQLQNKIYKYPREVVRFKISHNYEIIKNETVVNEVINSL